MLRPLSILPWLLLLVAAGLNGCAQPAAPHRNPGHGAIGAGPLSHVQVKGLNLRECPSTKCPVLAVLGRGEQVIVLIEQNGWSKVRTQSAGKTGWVSSKYLGRRPPAPLQSGDRQPRKAPAVPEEEFAPAPPAGQPPQVEEEFAPAGDENGQDSRSAPPPVSEEFGK